LVWGERETAARLAAEAFAELVRLDCKFQVQMLLVIQARWELVDGHRTEARTHFDRALGMAAAEGYIFTLVAEKGALQLIVDALVRGVEVAHCQKALAAIGERALAPLLELVSAPDAAARRAAIYPLAMIGGEAAAAAIRSLLHDPEESVRVAALLAVKSMGFPDAAPLVPAAAPAAEGRTSVSTALLGPMVVRVDGMPVQAWRTTKARDLLAFLVLGGDRPYARDQLGEALWPDGEPEAVTRLLHTSLHHLRRHLGAGAEGLIAFAGGAYQLNRESVALEVDLERFQRLAAAGDPAGWRAAAELYRGDLLDELDYPWVEAPRVRMRSLFMDLLRKLAAHLTGEGRPAEATEFLQLLIQTDPLAEDAHVALMECYSALGNRSAAIQQYRALAKLLDDELGLEPGARAQELYRRLLD
jgi:DNA-binding SARP family transcriptional activator